MNSLFEKLLGEAAKLTRGGKLAEATAAIQRALGGATPQARVRIDPSTVGAAVLDGLVRELPFPVADPAPRLRPAPAEPSGRGAPGPERTREVPASFDDNTYTSQSGTRSYKLFVPAGYTGRALPLVVMLHGCGQGPDDFAAGTRMNEVAQERGFLVLYPAQAPRSNTSKCWNWFVPGDQRRGSGEPDLLASLTRFILQTQPVDPDRVFVAGLSAGAAMADILGREYPDLYAAVGVHSGLPQGAAHDVVSAFSAMSSGAGAAPAPRGAGARAGGAPPTIVFHGDSDSTVHPSNGEQVIGATLERAGTSFESIVATPDVASATDRAVTRTVHRPRGASTSQPSLAEHWLVHGAGHAWSGGSPTGSYADARGPDASREMVRFFEEHPLQRAG